MPIIVRKTTYIVHSIPLPAPVTPAPVTAPKPDLIERIAYPFAFAVGALASMIAYKFTPSSPLLAIAFIVAGSLTMYVLDTRVGRFLFSLAIISAVVAAAIAIH